MLLLIILIGAVLLGTVPSWAERAAERVARGKVIYETHCARCHGADGSETSLYPGVKSLVDIARRMSAQEVIERSEGFVTVRLEGETAAALHAYLATFHSGGYARPELLAETDWVERHRNDPSVRIVDMRNEREYAAAHIPGAVRIAEGPLRDREDRLTYLPKPDQFAAMLAKAGISNRTHVVIYDDQGGRMAARLWYVLNAYGHERVSLVNGGWNQWVAEKRPTTTAAPAVAPASFTPRQTPILTCPSTELLARKPGTVVLDTRSPQEFRGERTSSGAAKAGRVPGAENVEWRENVTGPTLVFKSAEELRKLYESKGVTPDREIIAYCATGGRASHTLFALKLLGYPKVRIYYGSFTDYTARPDAPVEQ